MRKWEIEYKMLWFKKLFGKRISEKARDYIFENYMVPEDVTIIFWSHSIKVVPKYNCDMYNEGKLIREVDVYIDNTFFEEYELNRTIINFISNFFEDIGANRNIYKNNYDKENMLNALCDCILKNG